MKIGVVMNEGSLGGGGGGGLEWFYNYDDAVKCFKETKETAPKGIYIWLLPLEIPQDFSEGQITKFIEDEIDELQASNKPYKVK